MLQAMPQTNLSTTPTSKSKNKKKKKKKKSSLDGAPSVVDMMKLVKCDSTKKSVDWKEEYDKRKRETIDNIVSGKVETRVGSMSAFHAGPLVHTEQVTILPNILRT